MRSNRHNSIAILLVLPLAFLWQGSSCRSSNASSNANASMNANTARQSRDLRGPWGGEHISMQVSESGATIEYDCGRGRITENFSLDREGKFDVKGVHIREHGGPEREGDGAELPAVYRGLIKDRTMNLTVELAKDNEKVGTFTLTQGSTGRVRKCL